MYQQQSCNGQYQTPMSSQPPYPYQQGFNGNGMPTLLQQQDQNSGGGMSTGAKVAMAAAGGLAVGAGGMYLAEHMDDVGQALGSAEEWMEGAAHDVEEFVEDMF